MREEIVAQIEFNLPRDADQNPPSQELKNALRQGDSEQPKRIVGDLVSRDAVVQVISYPSENLGECNPDPVVKENRHRAPQESSTVLPEIGCEWPEILEHVVGFDVIGFESATF